MACIYCLKGWGHCRSTPTARLDQQLPPSLFVLKEGGLWNVPQHLWKTQGLCNLDSHNIGDSQRIPISLSAIALSPSYKLIMPSKPRGAAGEPVATDGEAVQPSNAKTLPPPSTEGMHKEEERCWTKLIKSLEWFIEQEPDEGPRRENIIACLHFAREHGYPEDPYCLWAVDGVARCMEVLEHIKITSSDRDYFRHSFATVSCGIYLCLPTSNEAPMLNSSSSVVSGGYIVPHLSQAITTKQSYQLCLSPRTRQTILMSALSN